MAEDLKIDTGAIILQYQLENEKLREMLAKLKLRSIRAWPALSARDVRLVMTSRLFWLGVGVGVALAFSYGIVPNRRSK